jgi:glycosyltransferase involved in cell wall biosynthesis
MTVQPNGDGFFLSIVIASSHSINNTEQVLQSLRSQVNHDDDVEIIVADSSGTEEPLLQLKDQNPDVLFLEFPLNTPLPTLWGAGIAKARGNIIAITDSLCIPDDQWIHSIFKAHVADDLIIGGAVESAPSRTWLDWAAYFCEYGQFMQPLQEGVVTELPGNNISFKRVALENGKKFTEHGFWKTFWCRHLQEQGIRLVSKSSIVVFDRKSYAFLPFLNRRFHHGKCFGGMRGQRMSVLRRGIFLFGSTLLPIVFLWRTGKAIVSKKRYVKEFVMSLPYSILAIISWSFGEFCGYLTGPGSSSRYIV